MLPRCAVSGVLQTGLRWRVGSLRVGRDAIEWRTRTESGQIALGSVTAVTGTGFALAPPPYPFDQSVLVHHLDPNNVPIVSALGFASVTVGNFPLQLAAALVGTIPARVVTPGAPAEDATFAFEREGFHIRRHRGAHTIALRDVTSISMHRALLPDGRGSLEFTLSFVEKEQVTRLSLSTTDRIGFLVPLLSLVQALRKNATLPFGVSVDDVPETTQQVAMLLYSGDARASSVEQMLGLAPNEVDKIYEDLLSMGLASVVKVRKEVQLTPAGASLVAAIIKRQMEIPRSVTP